jgi:uncharacterized membrane protein
MENQQRIAPKVPGAAPGTVPLLRPVTLNDVTGSLRDGWSDFRAYPLYGLAFGAVYVAGGLLMLYVLMRIGAPWMIIPMAIGFPLIAPFLAVGLYEISRRRAAGEPVTRAAVFAHVFRQRERQLGWMAFVVLFIFWIWIYQIRLLLALFLGFKSFSSFAAFLDIITTTPEGWGFLVVGTLVGAGLALALFSVTVVAMPMLMDREIDFISAMIASVATVASSPAAMIGFGLVVGVVTLLALTPVFLGLFVALPVLGHATWRLYARIADTGTVRKSDTGTA